MSKSVPQRRGEYSSLQRGIQILTLVQDQGRASAAEISELLNVPLSTVYRYINVLKESGFAIGVEGTLVPSERLSEGWSEKSNLVRLAAPILQRLRTDTQMTSMLAVRVHTAVLCLDVSYVHPQHRVAYRRGQMRNLNAGATALALLAHAPQSIVAEVLTRRYRGYTAATLDSAELIHELERIRIEGYAVSHGQTTPGMMGIGVPVFVNNSCIASVSLVDEERRHTNAREEGCVAILRAAAGQLAGSFSVDGPSDVSDIF